jgi:hypothetical protein
MTSTTLADFNHGPFRVSISVGGQCSATISFAPDNSPFDREALDLNQIDLHGPYDIVLKGRSPVEVDFTDLGVHPGHPPTFAGVAQVFSWFGQNSSVLSNSKKLHELELLHSRLIPTGCVEFHPTGARVLTLQCPNCTYSASVELMPTDPGYAAVEVTAEWWPEE